MAKNSKQYIYRLFTVLAIVFALCLIYMIFRRYSLKEGAAGNSEYTFNEIFDQNGEKIQYFLDEDNGGKIYDISDPENPIYTGLIEENDEESDEEESDDEESDEEESNEELAPGDSSETNPNIYTSGKVILFKNLKGKSKGKK